MKAVVYEKPGCVCLTDVPEPKILDARDAIVRVTRASICSSDLHIRNGGVARAHTGVVLGHEFVGEIVETGAGVKKFKAGDRVAVNVESFCGECFFCRRGYVNNCVEGGWELGCRIDGGQAELCRVPTADMSCTRIPDAITDEQALFVGDVLATGYWAAGVGEIRPADVVLVLGSGPTGLATMMSARLYGPATLIATDVNDERLALAKAHGLCDLTLNPGRDDVLACVTWYSRWRARRARLIWPGKPRGPTPWWWLWRSTRRRRRCPCTRCTARTSPLRPAASTRANAARLCASLRRGGSIPA